MWALHVRGTFVCANYMHSCSAHMYSCSAHMQHYMQILHAKHVVTTCIAFVGPATFCIIGLSTLRRYPSHCSSRTYLRSIARRSLRHRSRHALCFFSILKPPAFQQLIPAFERESVFYKTINVLGSKTQL
jgi:hypothetical protein